MSVIFALMKCFPWVTLPGVIPPTVAPEVAEVPPIQSESGACTGSYLILPSVLGVVLVFARIYLGLLGRTSADLMLLSPDHSILILPTDLYRRSRQRLV